jgi:hypothetical protein
MADEPDNLVLRHLREIRDKQDAMLGEMRERFAVHDREIAALKEAIVTGFTEIGARLNALERDMVAVKEAQGNQARHLNGLVNIVSSHDNTLLLIARHLGLVRA